MELGQQVERLISWKVEVMLDIHNLLVEDLNLSVRLFIGALIGQKINLKRLMPFILILQELWVMISIPMVFIGMINNSILTLMMTQKEFFKSIIQIVLTGKNQDLVDETILGNILQTNVLHSMQNFT